MKGTQLNQASVEIIEVAITARKNLLCSIQDLTQEQFNQKPNSNVWSIGEIVHHLYLTEKLVSSLLARYLERAIKRNIPLARKDSPSMLHCLDGFSVEVPLKKVKTPEFSIPEYGISKDELDRYLRKSHKIFLRKASSLCEYDLNDIRFPHPFLGKINMYQWILLVGKHEQRHTIQIENLKNSII
jgi:hypothetical protein